MIKTLITTALLSVAGVNVESITPSFNNVAEQTSQQGESITIDETAQVTVTQTYKQNEWEDVTSSIAVKDYRRSAYLKKEIKKQTQNINIEGYSYNRLALYKELERVDEQTWQFSFNQYDGLYTYDLQVYKVNRYINIDQIAVNTRTIMWLSGATQNVHTATAYMYQTTSEFYNQYQNITNLQTLTGATDIKEELDNYELINTNTGTFTYNYYTMNNSCLAQFENTTVYETIYIAILVQISRNAFIPAELTTTQVDNILTYPTGSYIQCSQVRITGNGYKIPIEMDVVDIPDIMFTVLTLPFAFISQSFGNLTLFEGTQYAVNIGNIILVVLAIFTLLFIIKKVILK